MPAPRPFALICTNEQWLRVRHEHTALTGEEVSLFWDPTTEEDDQIPPFAMAEDGLAFDSHCRLYHSVTSEGRIERLLWANHDPLDAAAPQAAPVTLVTEEADSKFGDFSPSDKSPKPLMKPTRLAVDADDRLFVIEETQKSILIFDLWSRRFVGAVELSAEPVDLVANGRGVYVLLRHEPGLIRIDARGNVTVRPWPAEITEPVRIALSPNGEIFVLERAATAAARVINYARPSQITPVPFATDIEFQTNDPALREACSGEKHVLVVARRPKESFRRFCIGAGDTVPELQPLTARGYDGRGLVRVPDGRIGFWAAGVFRHAVAAKVSYKLSGRVTTFRLDSGDFHTSWGRLFIDACIPRGTQIVTRCITADEPPEGPQLPRRPPENVSGASSDDLLPLYPPMPPQILADRFERAPAQLLHRRETGIELPWVRRGLNDRFETYEAPVIAEPGRYLWVRFELTGNSITTPKLRALRAEYPTHDYLRRIPKTFSRDERVARFLERYLAMFEGVLGEFEARADARAALLDPASAPAETLPWLAGFVGLVLDERMARAPRADGTVEDVRRRLIAQAIWLFRFRGTALGLKSFIEIYLGPEIPVTVLEKYRFRGMGGALLGESDAVSTSSVLGAGFRIGGAIGADQSAALHGSTDDAFSTHAHRFSIVIPAMLTSEQHDVIQQILDVHRPAHTLVEICTVAAGMRAGRGLHVGLTSIIGRSGGFRELQIGGSTLGREAVVGRPGVGLIVSTSRLGQDSRPG